MGLFSRKAKETCPICGRELSLLKQTSIEDGTIFICDECAMKLRGQFDLHSELHRSLFDPNERRLHVEDELRSLTLDQVKDLLAQREVRQEEALQAQGGAFDHVFRVEEVFTIAPKPLEVGIFKARAYKNRVVVRGMMAKGTLKQGDPVMIQLSSPLEVPVLELIPCTGIDLFSEMGTPHKKIIEQGGNAWLVLDTTEPFAVGTLITK